MGTSDAMLVEKKFKRWNMTIDFKLISLISLLLNLVGDVSGLYIKQMEFQLCTFNFKGEEEAILCV